MQKQQLPEQLSQQRLEAAQATFAKHDEQLKKLQAQIAKVEKARTEAEAELAAATAAHEAALIAADDRKRREKRWQCSGLLTRSAGAMRERKASEPACDQIHRLTAGPTRVGRPCRPA